MKKHTNEELLEILPTHLRESKDLTSKQKVVLGQLLIYNGLEKVKKDGYFFRSNKDLTNDCGIKEKTLIAAIRKLSMMGLIERKSGSRKEGASLYKINQKTIDDYCKKNIKNYSNNYSEIVKNLTDKINELEITVKKLVEKITVIEGKNYSNNYSNKIDEMELKINKLEDSIAQLLQKNYTHNYSENYSNNYSKNYSNNYSNQEDTQEAPIGTPIPTTITYTKITQKTIEEHMEELKLNGYEELKKEVDNELVGTSEDELKDSYYTVLDKMRKRQAILGKNYTRIRLYIDRIFNEKLELIQTLVSTDK